MYPSNRTVRLFVSGTIFLGSLSVSTAAFGRDGDLGGVSSASAQISITIPERASIDELSNGSTGSNSTGSSSLSSTSLCVTMGPESDSVLLTASSLAPVEKDAEDLQLSINGSESSFQLNVPTELSIESSYKRDDCQNGMVVAMNSNSTAYSLVIEPTL